MKNLSILTLFFLFFTLKSAFSQIRWKGEIGLNYSNISVKDDLGKAIDSDPVGGIYLGVGIRFPLWKKITLEPSINYSERGFKEEGDSKIGWGENFKTQVSYLFLPVDLVYSIPVYLSSIQIGIGPYLGLGLSGRWETSETVLIGNEIVGNKGTVSFKKNKDILEESENIYAKPFDYGLTFKLGYVLYNKYDFSFVTQRGLADLEPERAGNKRESSIKNQSFAFTLGYIF